MFESRTNFTEALRLFVPMIINAAMRSIEAAVLQRQLTDEEIDSIMSEVDPAVYGFVDALETEPEIDKDDLSEELRQSVYESVWTLIQEVTEEMKEVIGESDYNQVQGR